MTDMYGNSMEKEDAYGTTKVMKIPNKNEAKNLGD